MTWSSAQSARSSRCDFLNARYCVVLFIAIGLAGCGNSCFVGVFNNGSGGVTAKAGNPQPVCAFSQPTATIRVIALKSPVCKICTAATRVEHVFVTVRSIQLRPSATDNTNSPDWLEIAPHLESELRQIDLIGDSMPEILVANVTLPAGSYREVHVQLLPDSPADTEELPGANACGETQWNCLVMGDGHVEPLHLPGDAPELFIAIQSVENSFVLPDSTMDLRLNLEPFQVGDSSSTGGWKPQSALVGRASLVRRPSVERENSISN